jgi:hypothetical protein
LGRGIALVEKLESWSIYKYFGAPTLEEAIELAKADKEENWQFTGDDLVDYSGNEVLS